MTTITVMMISTYNSDRSGGTYYYSAIPSGPHSLISAQLIQLQLNAFNSIHIPPYPSLVDGRIIT